MKRLIIDIGNTRCKWTIFEGQEMQQVHFASEFSATLLGHIFSENQEIKEAILSSVRDFPSECRDILTLQTDFFIELSHHTPVPIVNRYKTPETLGLDRLAAAIGAAALYPGKPLLVIDAGTAITIDFVSANNEYLGGNISPGIETRFRALNQFTGKLPLVELSEKFDAIGTDTRSAIRAGVQQGVLFEIESYIRLFSTQHPDLIPIIAGGHATFIQSQLKATVILQEHLTLLGLYEILKHNSDK